jgi:hypothetical protein
MPRDLDGLADIVVLTVKSAMAPLLERLATAEQCNRDLQARVQELVQLRDRVASVETKSAGVAEPSASLTPLLERVASVEGRLSAVGDLRDRVVVMETKAAVPVTVPQPVVPEPVDLSPLIERIAGAEARLSTLGDLRDRVVTIETKAASPVVLEKQEDLAPALQRISALELKLEMKAAETAPILGAIADLTKDAGAIRERIAAVEVRAQIPGPPGSPGKDGKDGKDGVDGLGFDELAMDQKDDRSITVKAVRGDRIKEIGTARFPVQIQRGVYVEGKSYELGDLVTWGGSQWHANEETTSKPGDGSKAWTLVVKRGRDGKDGRDALEPVPVVSVGGRHG